MGWNAGGFGELTFPDTKAIEAWRNSEVSASHFDDWPENFSNHFQDSWNLTSTRSSSPTRLTVTLERTPT